MIRRQEFIATVVLIAGLLVSPWVAKAVGIDVFRVEPERPAAFPSVEAAHLLDAPRFAQLDDYLADRMPLRGNAAQGATRAFAAASGTSPVNNVFIGDHGSLFLSDDFTNPCSVEYSADQLEDTLQRWEEAGSGREIYLAIAPDKSSILTEFLPDRAEAANSCQVDREAEFIEAFSDTDQLIDSWQALRDAERPGSPHRNYFRYDAHWTFRGGLVFAEQVVDHLAPGQFKNADIVQGRNRRNPGAIARRMGWEEFEFRNKLGCARGGTTTATSLDQVGIHGVQHFQSTGTDDLIAGHTLVLHDSMMRYAEDPLACHFESLELLHWDDFDTAGFLDRIAGADRIIIQSVQRSIYVRTVDQLLNPAIDEAISQRLANN